MNRLLSFLRTHLKVALLLIVEYKYLNCLRFLSNRLDNKQFKYKVVSPIISIFEFCHH